MKLSAIAALVLLLAIQAAPPARELRGRVTIEGGGTANGVSAILFPADQSRWTDPKLADISRLVPVTNGGFTIASLPPGALQLGFTTAEGAKEFPSATLFKRLVAAAAMTLLPNAIEVEAVLSQAALDFRVEKSMIATTSVETVRSSAGLPPIAPPGRGRAGAPPPAGFLTGRVLAENDQAVAGVDVRLLRRRDVNGRFEYLPMGMAVVTDAEGRFVLPASPGEYVVLAAPYAYELGREPQSIRRAPASAPNEKGVMLGYVPTFHPATPEHMSATSVVVAAREVPGIDIRLSRQPVFELTGTVEGITTTFGSSPRLTISTDALGTMMSTNMARWAPIDSGGAFRVPDLPAGEFVVSVSTRSGWARETVRVGAGMAPVKLALRPPMSIAGTVEFHGDSPRPDFPPPAPGRPPSFQYRIELAAAGLTAGSAASPAVPNAAGTFSTWTSGPGPFRLRATYPAPWIQVSGFVDGIDTIDAPLPFGPGGKDARVVLADRPTSLVINIRDASDRPVPNVLVALFAEDSRYWLPGSRRAQAGPSTAVGTMTFTGLPAGKYLIAIALDMPATIGPSAALFERLRARATPVELALRESKSVIVQLK